MAVDELLVFKATRDGNDFGLVVKLDTDQPGQTFDVVLDLIDGSTTTLTINVDPSAGTINVTSIAAFSPTIACLSACGVGSILKILIKCFNKNRAKFITCIKANGLDEMSDAVKCALACLASAGASSAP